MSTAQRAFRLLALAPGADLRAEAAAALWGVPPARAAALLRELTGAGLVVGSQRYALARSARAQAVGQVLEEPAAVRARAVLRLLTWYRDCANAADRVLRPAERPNFESAPPRPGFADQAQALAWLDAEAANLGAAVRAAATDQPVLSWQIAAAMYGWLTRREQRVEWIALYTVAAQAAASAADPAGEALITGRLGIAYGLLGRASEAIGAFHRAYEIRLAGGDLLGAATGLLNIGAMQVSTGAPQDAIASLVRAKDLAAGLPDTAHFHALVHSNLAEAHHIAGRYAPAMHHYETALRYGESGCADRDVAQVLLGLALLCSTLGREDRARPYAERGLALATRAGDDLMRAESREALGRIAAAVGQIRPARTHLRAALRTYTAMGYHGAADVRDRLEALDALDASDRPEAPGAVGPETLEAAGPEAPEAPAVAGVPGASSAAAGAPAIATPAAEPGRPA